MTATNHGLFGAVLLVGLVLSWVMRGAMTRRYSFYWFMLWNMLLAGVPILALLALNVTGGQSLTLDVAVSGLWLLFLPNTFYLLTDFMHLNPGVLVNKQNNRASPGTHYVRGDPWYVVDSFLLFLTTLFAVVIGGWALSGYYEFLTLYYANLAVPVIWFAVAACAVGLYIGRFARWNSWDAIIKPHKVLASFIRMLQNKNERIRFAIIVPTIILFELFSLAVFAYFLS